MLVAGTSLGFAAFAVTQVVMIALMSTRIPAAGRGGFIGIFPLLAAGLALRDARAAR